MSINMTQDFAFETDDLKSFKTMLTAAVSVMFHPDNDQYVQLHINPTDYGNFWNDGSWGESLSIYRNNDKFEVLDKKWIKQIAYASKVNSFDTLDQAIKAVYNIGRNKPTRKLIAVLRDYRGETLKKNSIKCQNHSQMIEEAMKLVEKADHQAFFDRCGDGYNDDFRDFDGDIGVGYRMHHEPQGGWNCLYLSLVHAYYGE